MYLVASEGEARFEYEECLEELHEELLLSHVLELLPLVMCYAVYEV